MLCELWCPKCDAIYDKAEGLRERATADPEAVATPAIGPAPSEFRNQSRWKDGWNGATDDLDTELRLRVAALPVALLLAFLCVATPGLHGLVRVFLTMMVHELGHAITAWLCGFLAVPSLWLTHVAEHRGFIAPIFVAAGLGLLGRHGAVHKRPGLVFLAGALFVLQVIGTLFLSRASARALITFNGDGGCLVLGAGLMATFFVGRDTQIYKGWLRWGFLVIGAAAFADAFSLWWAARRNPDLIPFGENEGSGPSDPTVLVETFGWSEKALVYRFVTVGIISLLVLLCLWIYGVLAARAELRGAARPRPHSP